MSRVVVRRLAFALAFALAALTTTLSDVARAQTVRGTVVDRFDHPLPGVVVTLLDGASDVAAHALTDDRGAFRLRAPNDGTYRIRTLRIGFRPVTSDPIALAAGRDVTRRLVLTGIALSLDTVRVADRAACRTASDSAAATFAVWEQVRAALTAAQLTESERAIQATVIGYDRTLDRDFVHVREQSARVASGYVTQPWGSLSADSLHRIGYVVSERDGGTTYHAPGLDALLSPRFVEDHCFRLTRDADATRLGIAFEPTPARRDVPEIRGTLWLDRRSSELRRMDFAYVHLLGAQERHAGGDMEFARMSSGAWAISRWSIRMPVLVRDAASATRVGLVVPEPRVEEIRVAGGELALATRANGRDTLWARAPIALVGTVEDSTSAGAVPNARVAVIGTELHAVTDAAGRFAILGLLPGAYTVEIHTPALDSVGAVQQSTVTLADGTPPLRLRVASGAQVATMLCGRARLGLDDAVLTGTVFLRGDSTPRPDVTVSAEWTALTLRPGSESIVEQHARWLEGRTDARGAFRLCGLPRETTILLRAAADDVASTPTTLRIAAGERVARVQLVLDPLVKRGATFVGLVLGDSTLQPIAGAEVALPELSLRAESDERGAFRLSDVPAGEHRVLVRRVGYGPLDTRLTFAPNGTVDRRIFLSPVATLEKVVVEEKRRDLVDFDDNRRIGLGKFLTRDDLEKMRTEPLAAVLERFQGVKVVPGPGSRAWIASRRGVKALRADGVTCPPREDRPPNDRYACECYANVWLDGVLLSRQEIPNIARFTPEQLEGVEYYAGPAETPARYSEMRAACGTVVLHTRRTP